MKSHEVVDLFRKEVMDEAKPYLWSDTEVYAYLDDAQSLFCRAEGGIADSTSSITKVTVAAGEEFTKISPKILKIREAYIPATGEFVEKLNIENMNSPTGTYDYGDPIVSRLSSTTGKIRGFIQGMEQDKVRWVDIPSETTTVQFVVYRLPLSTIKDAEQELEIHEQHHSHLLHWMKARAYMKQDADTYDKAKAEQFAQLFAAYCDKAKHERELREHKPRGVTYGGI